MQRSMTLPALGLLTLLMACGQTSNQSPRVTAQSVTGAAFTTTNPDYDRPGGSNGGTPTLCLNGTDPQAGANNCNLYAKKEYVWLSGGPVAASMGAGEYFFAILEPGGQPNPKDGGDHNLSTFDTYSDRMFSVDASGKITNLGNHEFANNKLRAFNYEDTSNPGGVYILAVCSLAKGYNAVTASKCKYDAFKVKTSDQQSDKVSWLLEGYKYYDSNQNGQFDSTESGIEDWKIALRINDKQVNPDLVTTVGGYWMYASGPNDKELGGETVVEVTERMAASTTNPITSWKQTGSIGYDHVNAVNTTVELSPATVGAIITKYRVTVPLDQTASASQLNFGNVCEITPGGRTMGYWSNKNGQDTMTKTIGMNTALQALRDLNLRDAKGDHFDPPLNTGYSQYRNWLLNASATNMAYMLSAQLSATKLNVMAGFTVGTVLVDGTRTVNDLIAYADSLLLANSNTVMASAARTEQERVKNILDKINNQGAFVQSDQSACGTPTF